MSREFYTQDEILNQLVPETMTNQELEWAIEDSNRQVTWVQDDANALRGKSNAMGQKVAPLRQARNEFQQELDRRG